MSGGMVIVGAGEAGARAAMALRENGWRGAVTLIGEERHLPYERPPLSKAALTCEGEPAQPFILRQEQLAEYGIIALGDTAVVSIDRAAQAVMLVDGRSIRYDRLLLATGAVPRRLQLSERVLYLRRFEDALRLRSLLRPGLRVVVIGGGFIGLEVAASARSRGAEVTVLEMAPRILTGGVPAAMAEAIANVHRHNGVGIRAGVTLSAIEPDGFAHLINLGDGEKIVCDVILAGVGAIPDTALAERAGLAIENGIRADARLCTSDPRIYVAGDCCSFPHPLYGDRRIRLEAWRNAQDQGNVAARNMLGADEPHRAVPWFWSDQFDQTLQIAGLVDEGAETVFRDLGDAMLSFHIAGDGRLVAASGFGPISWVAKDIRLAEMLIAERAYPAPADLTAPEVRLKSLLARAA